MYIYELDAHNHPFRGDSRRMSADSSSFSSDDERSYATAAESAQRSNSGLGISSNSVGDSNDYMRSMISSQLAMSRTALGIQGHGRPGEGLPSTNTRVESREPGSNPDFRPPPVHRIPSMGVRQQQRISEEEEEAWDEVAAFLRAVTPPPTNYMSVPTEPYSPTISSGSIVRCKDKKGPLMRCLLFLRGGSKQKKPARKPSVRAPSPVARAASCKHKRPPQIKLPDTAVSGRTVDGHRHIAISIPIEHDHLGPEPRNRFSKASRRTRSLPFVKMSPGVNNDANVRPTSDFLNDSRMVTQLGPVSEERVSSSSKSLGRHNQRGQKEARKAGPVTRYTFGPAQEDVGDPDTGSMPPPDVPRHSSHRYDIPSFSRPRTPYTSDERRDIAYRKALAALSGSEAAARPMSGQSAHSFRSFTTASPASRVHYPTRKPSLYPGPSENRRPRTPNNPDQRGRTQHSRDSSRDQHTFQESIFSDCSILESMATVESAPEGEPGAIAGAAQARRLSATAEIVHVESPPATNPAEGQDQDSTESGESCDRESQKAGVQENKMNTGQERGGSSGPQSEVMSSWKSGIPAAAVLVNPEMKTVEAHVVTQRQRQQSVEVVLETPTEASWPNEMGENSGVVNDVGLRGSGDGPTKGTESRGEEKEPPSANNSFLKVPGEIKELKGKGKGKGKERLSGPLPSPKQLEEQRQEILLSRKQKIARLRKALEDPATQPEDLVWRRRLSDSSEGSSDESHPTEKAPGADKDMAVNVIAAASETGLSSTSLGKPAPFDLSAVMTVADVKPSSPLAVSPDLGITRQESLQPSVSSPATGPTVGSASPTPPYQSLKGVTPPDSPTSSSPVSSVKAQPPASPPRHPLHKSLDSFRQRSSSSGRQSPASSGRGSPIIQDDHRPTINTSKVKTSRSDLFERHEATREEQTRDLERRLKQLEKTRDHWMASMLPLLEDMSQSLTRLATGSEGQDEGKQEVDRSPEVHRLPRRPRTGDYHGHSDFAGDGDDDERRARSFSLGGERSKRSRRRARTSSAPRPQGAARLLGDWADFGTTPPVPALPLPFRSADGAEAEVGRREYLGRVAGRVDARLRSLSLGDKAARGLGSSSRYISPRGTRRDSYAAAAEEYNRLNPLEGMMRELHLGGSPYGMDIVDARDGGNENWGGERGPRAVVGFGAFST